MSSHPTSHDGERTPETRTTPDFHEFNVRDSFSNPITKNTPPGAAHRRLSRQQLEATLAGLSERDAQIIVSIQRFRYLASRSLKKLRELGLVDHLSRRIGGVRAGSGAMVWYITHAGERLIYLRDHTLTPTKRFLSPRRISSRILWRWRRWPFS